MLTGPKLKILSELVQDASKEELIWINGYLSGLINGNISVDQQNSLPAVSRKITMVYGTETGNSKRVATELAAKAKKSKVMVKLASLDQYRLNDLTKEENLFIIISTQGDGEPPLAARKFYDHIHNNGFRLDQVKYSVLALGDTSYPQFCKTGEEVDEQFQKLGAKRMVPIQKCDLDYDADAHAWFNRVLDSLEHEGVLPVAKINETAPTTVKPNSKKIYQGTVLCHQPLNDRGSSKETYHIELVTGEVDYLPGDSIGIVPENPLIVVNEIIAITGINPDTLVKHKDAEYTVSELLKKKINIHYLHERVIKKYAAIVQQTIPEIKTDLLELLKHYPVKDSAQLAEVLAIMPAQSPRIYTIASSPAAHDGEIHLTIEKADFKVGDQMKTGIGSAYAARLTETSSIDFFVQKNKRFKLPAEDKDIIMIGPGTGIAAFRSFLSERDATGASGKNWLFFGEEHFVSDFLYQTEIQNWFETGLLSKVSLAFHKDRPQGIYLAHKIIEKGKELYDWVQSGASIYICGEKAPMGVEVEKAWLQVIETYSGLTAMEALAYMDKLKEEGRYSKELY